MSKAKRGKSAQGIAGPAKWEAGLLGATFEEEKWKANITFVVGKKADDYEWINILGKSITAGTRRLFSAFSKKELFNDVIELGNPKGKKPKETPAFFEVCEPCKNHLDLSEEVPIHLLAKLMKFKLLWIKQNDMKRRENEKKAAAEKEKLRAKAAEKAGGAPAGGKERAKSPGKGKGGAAAGKKTPEPQQAKDGSKLKKRGEEDPEGKYIDDEPDDGADHYIIIYGFHFHHLFQLMSELGMSVNNIISINSQDYSRFEVKEDADSSVEKDEKTLLAEENAREEKAELSKEVRMFWRDLPLTLLRNAKLHDIARKDYEVKTLLMPENLEDPDQKAQFGVTLFEDIACIIYDLIDAQRQWNGYLENLKLQQVPVFGIPTPTIQAAEGDKSGPVSGAPTPAGQPAGSVTSLNLGEQLEPQQVDMRFYNDLMNCVPQESVSVPLIMNCMLEQIEATQQNLDPPSEQAPPRRGDGLNVELAEHIASLVFKLGLTDDEHKVLSEHLPLPKQHTIPEGFKQPLLMNPNDEITIRTHHLTPKHGFDPEKTEEEMQMHLKINTLLHLPRPTTAIARERAARLQELIHFLATDGLSQSEIDRAFKQFVFESMDLAGTDSNGFIITRDSEGLVHSAIPWDDPYPFFKGMIPVHEKESVRLSPVSDERSGAQSPSATKKAEAVKEPERSSTPDNRGILRPLSRSSSREGRRSRSPSETNASLLSNPTRGNLCKISTVHFEADPEGHAIAHVKDEEGDEKEEMIVDKTTEESMNDIVDAQKRQLDQWCFAEHFENKVLLQVLKNALYKLPFVDTYYHKRDHSLMVVLHNPHNDEFQNHEDWHTELHSNIGFRNYLDYVEESLGDWLKEEDAKYQAQVLSKELDNMRQDEENSSRQAERAAKKGKRSATSRSKSPKGSRTSSQERPSSTGSNMFIRHNSLKAWKQEQDRTKAEEEEKERVKSAKRSKSPKSPKNGKSPKKEEPKDDGKKGRPGSKGSAKSKNSKEQDIDPPVDADMELISDEKFWPFSGYDMGNNLIHVSGITSTLFPADGGQIRTERTEFTQGTVAVRTTVLKDDHVFTVHILDPKDGQAEDSFIEADMDSARSSIEKGELEKPEKENKDASGSFISSDKRAGKSLSIKSSLHKGMSSVSAFGSITAQFNDGMTLALSQFGDNGDAEDGKKYEPEPYIPPPSDPSPVPPPSPSKTKGKPDKKAEKTTTPEPPPAQVDDDKEDAKSEEPAIEQQFQQLFVSCPDGLNVKYMLESHIGMRPLSEDDRRLLVKQSYPYKTNGTQPCESTRKKYALAEVSRVITSEGTVIKNMMDGSVQVLYADGTVSEHTGNWALPQSRDPSLERNNSAKSLPDTPTAKESKENKDKKGDKPTKPKGKTVELVEEVKEDESLKSVWTITYPSGERIKYTTGAEPEELKPIRIALASDPATSQSMATRADRVMTVSYPDGNTILEHADGTRITTYYRETQVPVVDTVDDDDKEYEIQSNKFVKVECPGFATVEFNCMTSENLTIFGNGTTVNIFPDGYYMLHHYDGGRLEVDTEGIVTYFPRLVKNMEQLLPEREIRYMFCHNADVTVETVDPDGNVFNVKNNGDFNVIPASGDDVSDASSEDPRHERKVTIFKEHAPRFFVIHADGSGTELLRYQDIAEYLTSAEQSPATAVLRDDMPDYPGVCGITVLKPYVGGPSERWLKKYDQESIIPPGIRHRDLTNLPPKEFKREGPRFGTNVGQGLSVGAAVKPQVRIPIVKCPSALELRQLIQYKPMSDPLRDVMQCGLREYAEYVKSRNELADFMQVVDPRSDVEKMAAADLHSLSKSNNELNTYVHANMKEMYEKALTPPQPSPPPTPQPKRTKADWERDEREVLEEKEALHALRTKTIPKYFDSEFGKAFLLTQTKDINNTVTRMTDGQHRYPSGAMRRETTESTQSQPDPCSAGMPRRVQVTSQSDRSSHSGGTNQPKMPVSDTPMSFAEPEFTGEREMISQRLNVLGRPRNKPVPLPTVIKGGKPGAIPNSRYMQIEDPVRRRTNNSLTAGATVKGQTQLHAMRGLILLPEEVDFGVLKEGNTYAYTVLLKNTGVDTCRYKIKQPPPATGVKILYKPGPVAAGMKATVDVEIYAIAVGVEGESGVGSVRHELEIITETDIIFLPITATVLTTHEYDNRGPNSPKGGKTTGARLTSTKPPSSTGIIRPRKIKKGPRI